jgi:hypothetical protein
MVFFHYYTEITLQFKGRAKVKFQGKHVAKPFEMSLIKSRSSFSLARYESKEYYLDKEIVLKSIRKSLYSSRN